MKKVLSELYYGNINEAERGAEDLLKSQEYQKRKEIAKKLFASFSKEQKQIFDEYFFAEAAYMDLEKLRCYKNGIKIGFVLAIELNED